MYRRSAFVNLRLELFTRDLAASLDFYGRILGFEQEVPPSAGYTPLVNGEACIALNLHSDLDQGHPIRLAAHERPGLGVEIVMEVDDVEAIYQHTVSENWPRSAELQRRPWGLTDFRVLDPDGYYWRISSRR